MPDTRTKAIEGKVASVLNRRELVINRGSKQGVTRGMQFEIIEAIAEFLDPDTRDSLGGIERTKLRVRISDVQTLFSIARTYETYRVNESQSGFTLGSRVITKIKTISTTSSADFSDTAYERTAVFVSVGDKAVQMVSN